MSATKFRWVIIGLCAAISLINYLDRSAIAFAIEPIKQEFGLNDSQFGTIASAFGIGYLIMTLAGGILVDRFGSHKVWALAAFLWSSCTAAMGMASSFTFLFFLRTLLGMAEGPHFPALGRVISDWLPSTERAKATAIALSAVAFSSVLGAPLLSQMLANLGWKTMFLILGMLGITWSIIWFIVARDYPESSKWVSDDEVRYIRGKEDIDRSGTDAQMRSQELTEGTTTWKFMLFNPSLMANNIAFFALGYLVFFSLNWLPGYLEETYHQNIKQVGIFLIAPWATAGTLILFAGWLSDWLYKRTGSRRIARSHIIWICQLLSALCFIPVMFSHSLPVCITMISLGLGLGMMPNSAIYAMNYELAKDRAATSLGIMDCFFATAGILAPWATGQIVTITGSFTGAFGLMIGLTLLSVVSILVLQRADHSEQAPSTT